MNKAGGHFGAKMRKQSTFSFKRVTNNLKVPQNERTCGDVPDLQGRVCSEGETMSSAAVQDGVFGDLQRQFGLEALTGHTVGAL